MNERIKELARNALDKAVPQTWTTLSHEDMTNFAEVFAELIVQECADKAHEFIIEDGDDFPKTSVAYRIKQHFGVEE